MKEWNFNDDDFLNDLTESVKGQLLAKKGSYWARKVVYMGAMKASLELLRDAQPVAFKSLCNVIATDAAFDLSEKFPERDKDAMLKEFIRDVNELLDSIAGLAAAHGMLTPDGPMQG